MTKMSYNLILINEVLKRAFDTNKNSVFLFDAYRNRKTNKVFSPRKGQLYNQIKLRKTRYQWPDSETHGSHGETKTFLPIIAGQKKKMPELRHDNFRYLVSFSGRQIAEKFVATNTQSYALSRFNLLMKCQPANGEKKIGSRSLAPKKHDFFSFSKNRFSDSGKIKIDGSQIYSGRFKKPIDSDYVTSKSGVDESGVLSGNDGLNPQISRYKFTRNNRYVDYDVSDIEKFFFNMSRRPPSGGTAFDPLITPVWAGVKLPG